MCYILKQRYLKSVLFKINASVFNSVYFLINKIVFKKAMFI